MNTQLLILAEEDYTAPLDYRELLYAYTTAEDCRTRSTYWLTRALAGAYHAMRDVEAHEKRVRLSTELKSVNLGEYVAENESGDLERYFLETPAYDDVVNGATRILVGRKGAGKSATLLRAAEELRSDRRQLVCVIKPSGYDLEGVVRLLRRYQHQDARGYLVESLWKYLLYSELALALEQDVARRPAGALPDTPEWSLMEYVSANAEWLKNDFSVRLERVVSRLLSLEDAAGIEDERRGISQLMHSGPIAELRTLLADALVGRTRVAILVDNLDKAWNRSTDVADLVSLLLGLLTSVEAIPLELDNSPYTHDTARVTLSIFVRSDIYASITRAAREPDKLPSRRLTWPEPDDLIRLVEERFVANRPTPEEPTNLWSKFFTPRVRGQVTAEYLVGVTLARPRDVLYITRAAIDRAVARRHVRVEEEDVLEAERLYSQWAFEALRVEADIDVPSLDDLLLEFAGAPATLTKGEIQEIIEKSGTGGPPQSVLEQLRGAGFLGVETQPGEFTFTDEPRERQKADVLAERLASARADAVRYRVHRAFWSYLEIAEQRSLLHPAS
jgi:hypothetical protein